MVDMKFGPDHGRTVVKRSVQDPVRGCFGYRNVGGAAAYSSLMFAASITFFQRAVSAAM